ncbi:MAG: hypothetical protein AAB036_12325 [Elusimicrobiota bacterium]
MEPQDPVKLADYLERLLAGLEQTCESLKFEIPYYKPDDIQGRYAKKFLASVEEQAAATRARLEALRTSLPRPKQPEGQ